MCRLTVTWFQRGNNPIMTDEMHGYARVEEELMPGEELLWVGRPASPFSGLAGHHARTSIVALLGFLIALGIFLWLIPLAGVATAAPHMFFSPMWIPMILIFLLVLAAAASGPIGGMLNARRTTYAITNRRLLILDGILSTKVTSYGPDDIERIERRSRGGGSGDIIFRYEPRAYHTRRTDVMWQGPATSVPIGFFGIPDVRQVEQLLIETFMPGGEIYGKSKRKHDALDEESGIVYAEDEIDLSDLLPAQDADEPADQARP